MFERTLADLIRGLRASSKRDEALFIARAIEETRSEVPSRDMELKAAALLKLIYLDMLGYDMSWAAFNVIETMSSSKIHLKAVGYLAAVQSFNQDTELLMLATNTLKKDMSSPNVQDVVASINGLSHFVTPEIGRDVTNDLITLLNHSRPRIRKRAVLVLHKVVLRYPEALQRCMPRLREKLADPDPGVVSATVNLLCELSKQEPKQFLVLAPQLYDLIDNSTNNWMLIKVIKLFGTLAPHEPRLVKKLQKPIAQLISTTPAVSLLYECVRTCIIGGLLDSDSSGNDQLARMCITKLATFLRDSDQNLKYIALLAMVKIVPTHPHLIASYQDAILSSLEDEDVGIRIRALDLVCALVTTDNVQNIVQKLLSHLVVQDSAPTSTAAEALRNAAKADATGKSAIEPSRLTQNSSYRLTISNRIVDMCSGKMEYPNFTLRSEFQWYLSVLVDLVYLNFRGLPVSALQGTPGTNPLGTVLSREIMNLIRTRDDDETIKYTVDLMIGLVQDGELLGHCIKSEADDELRLQDVLAAAAWICGEYCSYVPQKRQLTESLLHENTRLLSSETAAMFIESATRLLSSWLASSADSWDDQQSLPSTREHVKNVKDRLRPFISSDRIIASERATNFSQLLTFVETDLERRSERNGVEASEGNEDDEPVPYPKSLYLLQPLYSIPRLPYRKGGYDIPQPPHLDLEVWFNPSLKPAQPKASNETSLGEPSLARKKKRKDAGDRSKKKTKSSKQNDHSEVADPDNVAAADDAASQKRTAELQESRKNDPFYLKDPQADSLAAQVDDVDQIPVVKLEGLLTPDITPSNYTSIPSGTSTPVVNNNSDTTSPKVVASSINAYLQSQTAPLPSSNSSLGDVPLGGGVPQYDAGEDEAMVSVISPEPIKVTKAKKPKKSKPAPKVSDA